MEMSRKFLDLLPLTVLLALGGARSGPAIERSHADLDERGLRKRRIVRQSEVPTREAGRLTHCPLWGIPARRSGTKRPQMLPGTPLTSILCTDLNG